MILATSSTLPVGTTASASTTPAAPVVASAGGTTGAPARPDQPPSIDAESNPATAQNGAATTTQPNQEPLPPG